MPPIFDYQLVWQMRGLECEEALVKIALNSGRIQGVEPLSLLLVGEPGWGKTTLLELFKEVKSVFYWADVDQGGMRKAINHVQMNGGMRHKTHIVIPDLTRVFSRKHSTVMNSLSYLTMLCEDGVCDTAVYGLDVDAKLGYQHVKHTARLGIISAITNECLDDIKSEFPRLKDTLLSRFIIKDISRHSPEKIALIAGDVLARKPTMLEQPLILLPRKTDLVDVMPLVGYKNERNMRDFRLKIDLLATISGLIIAWSDVKIGGGHGIPRQNQPQIANRGNLPSKTLPPPYVSDILGCQKNTLNNEVLDVFDDSILRLFEGCENEVLRLGTTEIAIKTLLAQLEVSSDDKA